MLQYEQTMSVSTDESMLKDNGRLRSKLSSAALPNMVLKKERRKDN